MSGSKNIIYFSDKIIGWVYGWYKIEKTSEVKNLRSLYFTGALNRNRTDDLILTMDVVEGIKKGWCFGVGLGIGGL